jgi:hypothetical protein
VAVAFLLGNRAELRHHFDGQSRTLDADARSNHEIDRYAVQAFDSRESQWHNPQGRPIPIVTEAGRPIVALF